MCNAEIKENKIFVQWYFHSSLLMKAGAVLLPILFIFYVSMADWQEWNISNILVRLFYFFLVIATVQMTYGWTAKVESNGKEIKIQHSLYHIQILEEKKIVKNVIKEDQSINYLNIKSLLYPMSTIWVELDDGSRIRLYDYFDGEINWERIIADLN